VKVIEIIDIEFIEKCAEVHRSLYPKDAH